eukprot:11796509-Alexandrium_andersonii.AAC.1
MPCPTSVAWLRKSRHALKLPDCGRWVRLIAVPRAWSSSKRNSLGGLRPLQSNGIRPPWGGPSRG